MLPFMKNMRVLKAIRITEEGQIKVVANFSTQKEQLPYQEKNLSLVQTSVTESITQKTFDYVITNSGKSADAAFHSFDDTGRFFTRLPLPIATTSAAHISALFSTTPDRKAITVEDTGHGISKEICNENRELLRSSSEAVGQLVKAMVARPNPNANAENFPDANRLVG